MKDELPLQVYSHWLAHRYGGLSTDAFFDSLDTLIVTLKSQPLWLLELSASKRGDAFDLPREIENAIGTHVEAAFVLRAIAFGYQLGILKLTAAETVIAKNLIDDEYGVPETSDSEIDSAFAAFHGHQPSMDHTAYLDVLHRRLSALGTER